MSSFNHGFDSKDYLKGVPLERVGQIHVAGPLDQGDYLLDTHDHPVPPDVWDLYRQVVKETGPINTLLEWDNNIPPLEQVRKEALKARTILEEVNVL